MTDEMRNKAHGLNFVYSKKELDVMKHRLEWELNTIQKAIEILAAHKAYGKNDLLENPS